MLKLLVFVAGVLVLGMIGFVLWVLFELVKPVLIRLRWIEEDPEVLAWKLKRKAVKADWDGKHEIARALYEEYLKLCPYDFEVQARWVVLVELLAKARRQKKNRNEVVPSGRSLRFHPC